MADAKKYLRTLRGSLAKALREPERHDPVYKACETLFEKADQLSLLRSNAFRRDIREKAERRYLQGYPPRKKGDTSYGDAINWEWMVHSAETNAADLVIVSRDADYGVVIERNGYINDHLRQEFVEGVGARKTISLYSFLTSALKQFKIPVTKQDVAVETDMSPRRPTLTLLTPRIFGRYEKYGLTLQLKSICLRLGRSFRIIENAELRVGTIRFKPNQAPSGRLWPNIAAVHGIAENGPLDFGIPRWAPRHEHHEALRSPARADHSRGDGSGACGKRWAYFWGTPGKKQIWRTRQP